MLTSFCDFEILFLCKISTNLSIVLDLFEFGHSLRLFWHHLRQIWHHFRRCWHIIYHFCISFGSFDIYRLPTRKRSGIFWWILENIGNFKRGLISPWKIHWNYSPFTNCWTSQSHSLLIFRCFTAYHVVTKSWPCSLV